MRESQGHAAPATRNRAPRVKSIRLTVLQERRDRQVADATLPSSWIDARYFAALRRAAFGSTAALNAAPATNFGTVEAGILIAFPARGL